MNTYLKIFCFCFCFLRIFYHDHWQLSVSLKNLYQKNLPKLHHCPWGLLGLHVYLSHLCICNTRGKIFNVIRLTFEDLH